jgi:hypothetical protein
MAEGFDSIMRLLRVIIFATNCKSSGGWQLEEDSNSKAMSISEGLATITETRGILITVNRYTTRTGTSHWSGGVAGKLCNGTHVDIDTGLVAMVFDQSELCGQRWWRLKQGTLIVCGCTYI